MKKKTPQRRSLRGRVRRSDLQWCYDRLSHLLYIWQNPDTVQAGFGPSETMSSLAEELPKIRAMNKLSDLYENKNDENIKGRLGGARDWKQGQRPRPRGEVPSRVSGFA